MESGECLFTDGKRRADYVLVTDNPNTDSLTKYLAKIKRKGLDYEVREGQHILKYFILIHLRRRRMTFYSRQYDVGLEEEKPYVQSSTTFLDRPSVDSLTEMINSENKRDLSSNDRIFIINKVLEKFGLTRLTSEQIIETSYPLHDGPCNKLGSESYVNDRQLLSDHWARMSAWNKKAPVDLIKKYFGTEIAFYFAWLEFYTLMLLPMAILGILVTIANIIIVNVFFIWEVEMVCEAHNITVCPACATPGLCTFSPLSSFSKASRDTYLFDNHLTVAFAICMSFWATTFINIWKRRSNILSLRWGVKFEEEEKIRPEYKKRATRKRRSIITGEDESFVPHTERVLCITLSCFVIFLVLMVALLLVLGQILLGFGMSTAFVKFKATKPYARILTMSIISTMQVIFMKVFGLLFYGKLCIKLTKLENPRTQSDFDKSMLYKKYLLAFTNNYAKLTYVAFVKGIFFEYPRAFDNSIYIIDKFRRDTCQPLNCVLDLGVQLAFILLLKRMVGDLLIIFRPPCARAVKNVFRRKSIEKSRIPQYEEEYLLNPLGRYALMAEFSEMSMKTLIDLSKTKQLSYFIQYGFVTFFVAAFPLAPLLALITNIAEHRLDAFKFITRSRRPVPKKVTGIGSWNGILLGMTFLSMVTNGFVIAFTSDFVTREMYRHTGNYNKTQYVNKTLSVFATKDYARYANLNPPETCVYRGLRYPYWHEQKYQKSRQYWIWISCRLIAVFVFEHIVFLLNGILVRAVPTVPQSVKDQINLDSKLTREAEMSFSIEERERLDSMLRSRRTIAVAGPIIGTFDDNEII